MRNCRRTRRETCWPTAGAGQHLDRAREQLEEFIKDWTCAAPAEDRTARAGRDHCQVRFLKNNEARYEESLGLYKQAMDKFKTPELEKEYNDLKAAWN